jgi:hypothetical protein
MKIFFLIYLINFLFYYICKFITLNGLNWFFGSFATMMLVDNSKTIIFFIYRPLTALVGRERCLKLSLDSAYARKCCLKLTLDNTYARKCCLNTSTNMTYY